MFTSMLVCCLDVGTLKGHHPQACFGAFVSTDDRPAAQLIFVKVTVHPALHMVTMERREWDAKPGMIWATHALAGRSSRSSVQV